MPLGTLNIQAIQAACYYVGRASELQAIIVHSVESEIKNGLAVGLAGPNWFGRLSCQSSANTIADPGAAVEMVAPEDTAWAVGNGNARTWSQEHAGRAAFSRAQWTTSDGLAMLKRSAAAAAIVVLRYGIPVRWLSVVQLASGEKGFATHNDCRLAFGGTDHTDPGPGFPYDIYIRYVADFMGGAAPAEEDDMFTDTDRLNLTNLANRIGALDALAFNVNGGDNADGLRPIINEIRGVSQNTAAGVATLLATGGKIDPAALGEAIVAALPKDIAKQVGDEIGRRLSS